MSIDPDEIRSMTMEERIKLLEDLRLELMKLRAQAKMGTLDNTSRIRIVRKNIARILTIINEEKRKIEKGKK